LDIKNKKLLSYAITATIVMFCMAFASVPLYNIFCKATGTGGAIDIAKKITNNKIGKKVIKVNFDANVDKNLPWKFKHLQQSIELKTGETGLAFYYTENTSNKDILGIAAYNVTPFKAAKYFVKIQCFCFENQLLKAGQKVNMPVLFLIDPEIENDKNLLDVNEITLSYSFYKVHGVKQ
jgi:cytochrome c oxidase assembly protein subunit 11